MAADSFRRLRACDGCPAVPVCYPPVTLTGSSFSRKTAMRAGL
jgi:hypothetical protein